MSKAASAAVVSAVLILGFGPAARSQSTWYERCWAARSGGRDVCREELFVFAAIGRYCFRHRRARAAGGGELAENLAAADEAQDDREHPGQRHGSAVAEAVPTDRGEHEQLLPADVSATRSGRPAAFIPGAL